MKNIILITFSLIFLIKSYAQIITQSDAELVAKNFIETTIYKTPDMPSAPKRVQDASLKRYNGHDSYYTINFENGGIVIVSAIEDFEPILAYSPDGHVSSTDLAPDYVWWMSQYDEMIDSIYTNNLQRGIYQGEWQRLKTEDLDYVKSRPVNIGVNGSDQSFQLLSSTWGQSGTSIPLYNKFVNDGGRGTGCSTGKCPSGCVATAIGQVMRYWGYPVNQFDWCNMPDQLSNGSTTQQIDAVAFLLANIGDRLGMNYCSDSQCQSGAYMTDAFSVLTNYGYSVSSLNNWIGGIYQASAPSVLRNELDTGRPIILSGFGDRGGHAWVLDGYDKGNKNYFHFNWGWNGQQNMFFLINDQHDFADNMNAIVGINHNDVLENCDNSVHVLYDIPNSYYPIFKPQAAGTIVNGDKNPDLQHLYQDNQMATFRNGSNAEYKAYNSIQLLPGVKIEQGAYFTAQIIPCPSACSRSSRNLRKAIFEEEDEKGVFITSDFNVEAFPNPFTNEIKFSISIPTDDEYSITLFTMEGKQVFQSEGVQEAGTFILNYDLSMLESGIYLCQFKSNKFITNLKIVKE